MSLPAFEVRTADAFDTLVYPPGSHVGTDVATDVWSSVSGYMLAEFSVYGSPTALSGGAVLRTVAQPSNDQWVAGQLIIPLDGQPGTFPGARVTAGGDGYFIYNMGYTDGGLIDDHGEHPVVVALFRKNGSTVTALATWWLGIGAGSGDIRFDDGSHATLPSLMSYMWDGFFGILEVAETNPVELRVSVGMQGGFGNYEAGVWPPNYAVHPGWASLAVNGEFKNTVVDTCVLQTVFDSSASRITQGRPGMWGSAVNVAGGLYGFSYGSFAASPVASAGLTQGPHAASASASFAFATPEAACSSAAAQSSQNATVVAVTLSPAIGSAAIAQAANAAGGLARNTPASGNYVWNGTSWSASSARIWDGAGWVFTVPIV